MISNDVKPPRVLPKLDLVWSVDAAALLDQLASDDDRLNACWDSLHARGAVVYRSEWGVFDPRRGRLDLLVRSTLLAICRNREEVKTTDVCFAYMALIEPGT